MKKVSEKLHLSLSTVEATYRQEGFEIKNPRNKTTIIKSLNEFFISDNVMGDLRKNFSDFKTTTDFKRYPWASSVNDLYELAAKLDKSVKKPNSYRYLSADELSEIFRLEAQQIAEPIPIWHSIKSILNIAQMQIFNLHIFRAEKHIFGSNGSVFHLHAVIFPTKFGGNNVGVRDFHMMALSNRFDGTNFGVRYLPVKTIPHRGS